MEVKLRGLDRYEVEAIQYDGTNSDEICQFILEHEPDTQIEGAFLNKGTDKKMMAVIVIPSGEDILVREKEWLVHVEVPYGNQNSFYVMTDEERQDRFEEVEERLISDIISMGKIYDRLQKQLQVEEHREDAEDCIKIYNKLKEMNDGSVWSSDWQVLTTIGGWIGERPHAQMAYKPSKVGYVFLNGIRDENTNS